MKWFATSYSSLSRWGETQLNGVNRLLQNAIIGNWSWRLLWELVSCEFSSRKKAVWLVLAFISISTGKVTQSHFVDILVHGTWTWHIDRRHHEQRVCSLRLYLQPSSFKLSPTYYYCLSSSVFRNSQVNHIHRLGLMPNNSPPFIEAFMYVDFFHEYFT